MRIAIARLAIGLALVAAPALAAEPAVTLLGDVKLEKTVVENGTSRQVLITPEKVVPGDRLVFSTAYHNSSAAPVEQFVVTNPLPTGVSYASDQAGKSEVSVDGGTSWGQLAALTIADDKGGTRGAEATDVTHVRWTLAVIAPGASGSVSYNAMVR